MHVLINNKKKKARIVLIINLKNNLQSFTSIKRIFNINYKSKRFENLKIQVYT